jgi:IS605 OrfB family transposase
LSNSLNSIRGRAPFENQKTEEKRNGSLPDNITQRAYQFRLKVADPDRPKLHELHLRMNDAVSAWAVSLLTLRGGVSSKLAHHDDPVIQKWRRILCVLSWFSVESADQAPKDAIVERQDLIHRFLTQLEVSEESDIEGWYKDCESTLLANNRDDAVWVDRAKLFRESGASPDDIWDLLDGAFGGIEGFFAQATADVESATAVKTASQWLSSRFGAGKGTDFTLVSSAYEEISLLSPCPTVETASDLAKRIRQPGPPNKIQTTLKRLIEGHVLSVEEWESVRSAAADQMRKKVSAVGRKGPRPWSDALLAFVESACRMPYRIQEGGTNHSFHTTALDMALRRVIGHHRLQVNQEMERIRIAAGLPDIPKEVFEFLNGYCEKRTRDHEAVRPYFISERAIGGWSEIVAGWRICNSAENRIQVVNEVQAVFKGKFGDPRLFRDLASPEAEIVWREPNQKEGVKVLPAFAKFCEESQKLQGLKIPLYRHIDPFFHPIFTEFGSGRLKIDVKGRSVSIVGISGGRLVPVLATWQSFQLGGRECRQGKGIRSERHAVADYDAVRMSLELNANGRLVFPRDELEAIGKVKNNLDLDSKQCADREGVLFRRMPLRMIFAARVSTEGAWADFARENGLPTGIEDRLFAKENQGRKNRVRFQLSRIPNLKVVGVDLRMRHSAAVAQWEALSPSELQRYCELAQAPPPPENSNSFMLKVKNERGGVNRLIFRRTAPDVFADGTPSPTSWARLISRKRIFVDGEGEDPRKASPSEIEAVVKFFAEVGVAPPTVVRIDLLQRELLRRAQIELRRHSTYAELAWVFSSDFRLKPNEEQVPLTENEITQRLHRALRLWHRLAFGRFDTDLWAQGQWGNFLGRVTPQLPELQDAKNLLPRRKEISKVFAARWNHLDNEWTKRMQWIQDWILPRTGKPRGQYMHRGGLSLGRIRLVEDLDALVRTFRGRPIPTNIRMRRRASAAFPGERSAIRKIAARLREERCRKIAASIVHHATGSVEGFVPAQVVVIEDLSRYRPDANTRKRDENRKLAEWCAGRIAQLIKRATEVKGIRLLTISPQYTSLQNASTSRPGLPCTSITAKDFLSSSYWQNELVFARKAGPQAHPRQKFLLEIMESLLKLDDSALTTTTLLLPDRSGKELVSVDGFSTPVDYNAAANIGLKPLLDPEFTGCYWYIPVVNSGKDVRPNPNDTDGCQILQGFRPRPEYQIEKATVVNLWRDPEPRSVLPEEGWQTYRDYMASVETRLIEYLRDLQSQKLG